MAVVPADKLLDGLFLGPGQGLARGLYPGPGAECLGRSGLGLFFGARPLEDFRNQRRGPLLGRERNLPGPLQDPELPGDDSKLLVQYLGQGSGRATAQVFGQGLDLGRVQSGRSGSGLSDRRRGEPRLGEAALAPAPASRSIYPAREPRVGSSSMSWRKEILSPNLRLRARLSWVRISESRPISRKVTFSSRPLRSSPEVSSTTSRIRGISRSFRGTLWRWRGLDRQGPGLGQGDLTGLSQRGGQARRWSPLSLARSRCRFRSKG